MMKLLLLAVIVLAKVLITKGVALYCHSYSKVNNYINQHLNGINISYL